MSILDMVNIDMDTIFPVVCVRDYDDDRRDLYYKRLLRSTISPLSLLLVLFLFYQFQIKHLEKAVKSTEDETRKKYRDIKSTFYFVALFLSFMILPPTSRTIFEFFAKHEFPETNSCYLCMLRPPAPPVSLLIRTVVPRCGLQVISARSFV